MAIDSTLIRGFWAGTHAALAAEPGWSRDTAFDGRFLQGDDAGYTGPADAGGDPSHTANEHTHTGDIHRHTFSGSAEVVQTTVFVQINFLSSTKGVPTTHPHSSVDGSFNAITYQNTAVTVDSDTTAPPSVRVIVMKPDDPGQDIPISGCCFTDEIGGSIPTGFEKCDGGGARPSWVDKFVRGATTGNDGDDAGEGSATHANAVQDHNHDPNNHGHANANADPTPSSAGFNPRFGRDSKSPAHHQILMNSKALSDVNDASLTLNTAGTEPAYVKLLGIQNTSDGATTPVGVICAFVGPLAALPGNWELYSAAVDKQIRSTGTDGQVDVTGGSNTHTHTFVASGAHNHTHSGAHDHVATMSVLPDQQLEAGGATITAGFPADKHDHIWTINGITPTMQNTNVTLSGTDDGRQEYRTILWVKKIAAVPPLNAVLLGANF